MQTFGKPMDRTRRHLSWAAGCALFLGLVLLLGTLLVGCDQTTRHKVLTTVFDGVPELPPAQDICEEYYQKRLTAEQAGEDVQLVAEADSATKSGHKPFLEKRCGDCHSNDKSENGGLIRPRRELCFVCHKDFVQGSNVHGPVAIGDCLACHLPHTSPNTSLLRESKADICKICHQERRLAETMHNRFLDNRIICGECHDPHAGNARYFLR